MPRITFLIATAALLLVAMPADAVDLSACVKPNGKVVWGPCHGPHDREVPLPMSTSLSFNFVVAAEDEVRPAPECPAPGCGATPIDGAPFRLLFDFGGIEFDISCELTENLDAPAGVVRMLLRAGTSDTTLIWRDGGRLDLGPDFSPTSGGRFILLPESGIFSNTGSSGGLIHNRSYIEFFQLASDIIILWRSLLTTDFDTQTCSVRGWVEVVELPAPTMIDSAE